MSSLVDLPSKEPWVRSPKLKCRRLLMATILCLSGLVLASSDLKAVTQIDGVGATFCGPIYQRWFQEYNRLHPEIEINYQPIGSGAGIKQFTKGTVDFGASDAAMDDEQIAVVPNGVVLLPMTAGSIVLSYNLPGIRNIRLSRAAYSGIFSAR